MLNLKIILILLFIIINRNNLNSNSQKNQDECLEYWISSEAEWKTAYDDVLFCDSPLIIQNDNNNWIFLYPGSLTLINDTIHVNEENGIPNTCLKIGELISNQEKTINFRTETLSFFKESDSVIYFNSKKFILSEKTILFGCSCINK